MGASSSITVQKSSNGGQVKSNDVVVFVGLREKKERIRGRKTMRISHAHAKRVCGGIRRREGGFECTGQGEHRHCTGVIDEKRPLIVDIG